MRVLLLNPPFTEYGGLKGHGGLAPPLNLGYLASYLREKASKHRLSILDCEALGLTYEKIEEHLKKESPDILAITAPTPAFAQVIEIAKIAKRVRRDTKVVVGGPHPCALPEETARIESIDFVIIGEGEITFHELIRAIEREGPYNEIDGIVYKERGRIIKTGFRKLIENLDILPFPARDLMPHRLYHPPPTKRVSNKHSTSMITSRGCPYDCTYCIAKVIWTRRCRLRSPKNVVDEIEECVKRHNLAEINFHDELFTLKKERTREICREIKRRRLDIAWVCMVRVDSLSSEMLREMKEAGCKKVQFGFESGSQEILDNIKKETTVEEAREAVRLVKKYGIKIAANFMIGNIGETEESVRKSIELAKEFNTDTTAFFVASPYPGTEFYKLAKEKGYLRKDLEWKDFTLVSKNRPPHNLPGLSCDDILLWQKRAHREVYLRPQYILKRLKGIRSFVDIKNLIEGGLLFLRMRKG